MATIATDSSQLASDSGSGGSGHAVVVELGLVTQCSGPPNRLGRKESSTM